ncbi:MAG: PqiC family protein [Caldimonas sp.]
MRPLITAPVLAAVAVLVACSSAPAVRHHTLMPAEPPSRPQPGASTVAIVLEPVRVPAQVDQPQWLVRGGDGAVAVLEQERWASPLADELRQALLEQWTGRFGATAQRGAAGAPPPLRIGIDIRRFDSVVDREARVDGTWTLTPGDARARPSLCEWAIREGAGPGMPALADAHRRAVMRLAEAIGSNLAPVARGEPARCPPPDTSP